MTMTDRPTSRPAGARPTDRRPTDRRATDRPAHVCEDEEQKLKPKKRTKAGLTNADLGRIVCGRADDKIEVRAFERAFTPEKIGAAWEKVGAAPLTRAGLEQKKVRHEPTEGDPEAGKFTTALAAQHAANTAALAAHGADASVFAAALPRRELIERPTGEAAQLAALVESGVTHTSVWNTCGAKALNCDLVLAAEAVKTAGERAVAEAAGSAQQSSLSLLRDEALAAETQRDHDSKDYDEELPLDTLKKIVKCLFQWLPAQRQDGLLEAQDKIRAGGVPRQVRRRRLRHARRPAADARRSRRRRARRA